jgi:RHS repeat-associated protein
VTDTYDYDAFGNLVAATGSTPNKRLYTSEELDLDLGAINVRARQYAPGTGRFLTIDPVMGDWSRPLTLNRYLYANADPVNGIDPLGTTTLFEYKMQIDQRVYSFAVHSGHHYWTILGIKIFCVHIQLLTYWRGIDDSQIRIQIPLFPLCRLTKF